MKQMCPKLAKFFVEECFAGWTPSTPVSVGPPKNVSEDYQFWCQIYNINPTTPLSPRCLFTFSTFDWVGGGGTIWERDRCLFNLAKMMASVCLKELENKVKKLNCKKGGGGLIYFLSLHSGAYKREGLTWEGKLNRGFTVVKIMLILHSSCLHQQIILKSFILF